MITNLVIRARLVLFFFFFLRILSILTNKRGEGEKVLKKLTVVYIQKGLTYTHTHIV